ncbi:MAG TPA: YceI family protein [Bryobacteraceae bacterium]|nr:YceI family protein [Bryobacteraceae bacterium]
MIKLFHSCCLAALLAALAPAAPPSTAAVLLRVDPDQTKVEFTLGAVLHTVHGSFKFKRGEIRFDPAGGAASGELVLDAVSAETGDSARDKTMHKSVLESARFPEIVFRPDRVEGPVAAQGSSQVKLHGVFSIHGADHEMEFPVEVEASGGEYRATVKFSVPFVEWGMKDPSTLFLRVEKHVDLTLHVAARAAD